MTAPLARGAALAGWIARRGRPGSWTAAGGTAQPVRLVPSRPDTVVGFGETQVLSATARFKMLVADAPSVAKGDGLTFEGTLYVVQSARTDDPERLVWTLDCAPA
ncbi:MAG: hypothetical protein GC191_08145 [Azospirillum sp.]|nr:hypothetical protein [Azospirillum sp.]